MQEITFGDLAEWRADEEAQQARRWNVPTMDDLYYEGMAEQWQDPHESGVITAQQRLDYLRYTELSHCPRCGTRYAEVTNREYPDMVGETYISTWECCGYTESANTALVYRNGVAVDVR